MAVSAAEAVRAAIVAAELAVYPGVLQNQEDGTVQCFVGDYPNNVDDIITLKDVSGHKFGRDMTNGHADIHHGVAVTVRSLAYEVAYDIMKRISTFLAELGKNDYNVRDSKATVLTVYKHLVPTYVGQDETRRHWWGMDLRVVYGQTPLGD